jgi:hypothetical protein
MTRAFQTVSLALCKLDQSLDSPSISAVSRHPTSYLLQLEFSYYNRTPTVRLIEQEVWIGSLVQRLDKPGQAWIGIEVRLTAQNTPKTIIFLFKIDIRQIQTRLCHSGGLEFASL